MGNGAKAQQKRERNQKDSKAAKSQLKVNQKAMNIQCQVCKATFLQTTKAPALLEHASNKHNKAIADCFPTATRSCEEAKMQNRFFEQA